MDLAKLLEGGSSSLIAIAVGSAEGTRSPDGKYTAAWIGHCDPGNQVWNLGSFSYQHGAASPEDADFRQLEKLRNVLLPRFESAAPAADYEGRDPGRLITFVTACDLFTQSELACIGHKGFLDLLPQAIGDLVWARCEAYKDPTSGQLDAPGFGNSYVRLWEDQTRRQKCLEMAIAHWRLKQTLNKGDTH